MKFGINNNKKLCGASLYIRAFQIVSLIPLLYILTGSGYPALFTKKGILSVLFDFGISALPRAEALAVSAIYSKTASEVFVYFIIIVFAFVFGIAANSIIKKSRRAGIAARIVFAAFIAADLIIRLLPFGFNSTFGIPAAVFGFVIRLAMLILILLDFGFDKKESE